MDKPWYSEVNMCKYVSLIIDTLNQDHSISTLLNPVEKIHNILDKQNAKMQTQQTIEIK